MCANAPFRMFLMVPLGLTHLHAPQLSNARHSLAICICVRCASCTAASCMDQGTHIFLSENSFMRPSSGVMVAHLMPTPCLCMSAAVSAAPAVNPAPAAAHVIRRQSHPLHHTTTQLSSYSSAGMRHAFEAHTDGAHSARE